MKPIKLVIKGLNSFIEEQTVDFEKLTDRGLFGIFGPTGSGKSTILDGMTLALYGDISRKSSNFINTNCNDLNVSYTFQISGSTKRIYVVNRQFRRDKRTGNSKTHAASIKEWTQEGEKVLAESVTSVNKTCREILGLSLEDFTRTVVLPQGKFSEFLKLEGKQEKVLAESVTSVNKTCREILGLSLEDFTRTVVLPQGKFSEFLKLEGKQRREMLERLFNLQDYGERLAQRLSRQMSTEREKSNQLIGELNVYEEISEDRLNEEKAQLEEVSIYLEDLKKKQAQVESRYKIGEEIWNLQQELKEYKQKQYILANQAERMSLEEVKMKRGESALSVYPYMESYEKRKEELKLSQSESIVLENKVSELTQKKQEVEVTFNKLKEVKETQLPQVKAKSQQLVELIQDNQKVIELEMGTQQEGSAEAGIGQLMVGLKKVQQYIKSCEAQEISYSRQLAEVTHVIEKAQKDEQLLKVEQVIRDQIDEGVKLTQSYEFEKKNHEKSSARQKELQTLKMSYEEKYQQAKEQLDEKNKALEEALSQYELFTKEPPVHQETLLRKQEALTLAKEKWQRLKVLNQEIEVYLTQNKVYEENDQKLQGQVNEKQKVVEALKERVETARLEHLAHNLRRHLHEGEACPVCGSKAHPIQQIAQKEEPTKLNESEALLKKEEQELEQLKKALVEVQMQLGTNALSMERLQKEQADLTRFFEEKGLETQEKEFNNLSEALQRYEENKRHFEEQMNSLKEEKNKFETDYKEKQILVEENQKQLRVIEAEVEGETLKLKALKEDLESLKEQVKTQDFIALYEELKVKDCQREELIKQINEQSEVRQKLLEERENAQEKYNSYKVRFQRGLATFDAKQKSKQVKQINEQSEVRQKLLEERENAQEKYNSYKVRFQRGLATFDAKQKSKQDFLVRMGSRIKEILELKGEGKLQLQLNELLIFLKQEDLLKKQLKGELYYESLLEDQEDTAHEVREEDIERACTNYPLLGNVLNVLEQKLQALNKVMESTMEDIESEFAQIEISKNEVDREYEKISKKLLEVKTQIQSIDKQLKEDLTHLEQKLREANLTEDEVRAYLLTKEQIEAIREGINQYKEDCAKLAGAISAVQDKLGERQLEEKEWAKLQEEKQEVAHEVLEVTKHHTNLVTLVRRMSEALERLGKLREEKKKIDHKIAILTDLDKLFKGKRFVEFVAATRLKYVSLEASKKLKEITNGNYGLEVDEDSKFIIRDYKNGGAQRDASTLSGGETFLASLSLALALSAEIQLKGTVPLELFFLDEGFGTLDDDLLEVVMTSLEKIHHDQLKIGIISHVESVKNRVPVKLLLTPAEAGRGGTKVKLERS